MKTGRSLGIVRPDSAGLKFFWKNAELEEQEDSRGVQASLLEEPLRPLAPPELTFFYRYRSGDKQHTQSIQDWEVQRLTSITSGNTGRGTRHSK